SRDDEAAACDRRYAALGMANRRPATAVIVVELISGRLSPSAPGTVGEEPPNYFSGMKLCRNIGAQLIRDSLELMRPAPEPTPELRALAGAVHATTDDAVLVGDWRAAIDGLRVLYHASPFGTARQRALLLGVAANTKLVAAMRAAVEHATQPLPTWSAV